MTLLRYQQIHVVLFVFNTVFMRNSDEEEVILARCHYTEAQVDEGVIYKLYDDAYVQVSLID